MKRKIKLCKGLSILMVICMLFGINTTFLAAEKSVNQTEYLEEHYQVNFKDVDVFIVDGKELIIEEENRRSFWTRNHVQSEIDMLQNALNNAPDMKEKLIDDLQEEEELMAVSIADAPVVFVEDHYERVATSEENEYGVSSASLQYGETKPKEGNFYLYTSVRRDTTVNSNGTSKYTTTTGGYWGANSFLGGKKYPGSGEDYVLQSTPKGWIRTSDSMNTKYDTNPKTGVNGTDYWASLSLNVTVSASTERSVVLEITPSIKSKSWELYSYVSFNF